MSLVKCCFDTPEISDVIETMVQKCTDPGCKYYCTEWPVFTSVTEYNLIND